MLNYDKVQEVITLLRQGLSRQEAAKIAGISLSSIYRIERTLHRPKNQEPVRCPGCGYLVILPCRICKARQALRPDSSLPDTAGESGHLPLALQGGVKERYLEMRRKVEQEIADGTRTPLQYARASSGIYD